MISGVNCLVTGGAGFVGASLVRHLLDGGAHVSLLVRPQADLWRLKNLPVKLIQANLNDPQSVKNAVSEAKPELVYHLAAHGGYPFQKDARQILETNLMGAYNLLEACAESPCRLFVNAGSSSEYGFKKEPMRETDRIEPNSYYAVGKAAATHLCAFEATRSKFSIVTLRLFSVFGPYEETTRFFPTLIRRALRDEPIDLVSPETARDFIYLTDAVDAFLRTDRLLASSGNIFNVGSGVQSTIGEAVRLVMELTGSKSELRWRGLGSREWDATTWVASIERTREGLAWRPKHTLSEGIKKTIDWMREAV